MASSKWCLTVALLFLLTVTQVTQAEGDKQVRTLGQLKGALRRAYAIIEMQSRPKFGKRKFSSYPIADADDSLCCVGVDKKAIARGAFGEADLEEDM